MRAWNADPKHSNPVQFLGLDMQITTVAHATVAAFLARVAPDAAPALLAPIEGLGDWRAATLIAGLSDDERRRVTGGLAAIANALDAVRNAWARTSIADELDDVRHDLTILEQATARYSPGGAVFNVRDRAMATNI